MKKLYSMLAAILLLAVMACGGGGDSNGSGNQTTSLTSATISSSGGVVEVTDKNSPIYGVKIEVPENAVSEPTTFTISEATNLQPPHDHEGVSRGIKVDLSGELNSYVLVTVPLTSIVSEEDILICSSFNDRTGKWEEIPLSFVDYANKSVSFLTNHFSSFKIYIGLASYSVPDEDLDSVKFDVIQDSFNFNNNPNACFGMSNYAVWYFIKYSHGLFNHWNMQDAAQVSKEAHAKLTDTYVKYGFNLIADFFHNQAIALGHEATRDNLIYSIHVKKKPTVLVMNSYKFLKPGHAVVVYGYKKTASDMVEFYGYDPEKPQKVFIVYCAKSLGLWYFSTSYGDAFDCFGELYLGDSYEEEFQKIYDNYKASTGYMVSGQVTFNGFGLAGVTVTLTGTNSVSTKTDSSGNYSFSNAANGSYTLTVSSAGYSFNPSSQTVDVSGSNVAIASNIIATPQFLNTDMIAYYSFSGNANDMSGNGNNGTVYGATLTSDRAGNPNSAFHFDGINSYIQSSLSSLVSNSSFTVAYWMRYELQDKRVWLLYFGNVNGHSYNGFHCLINTNDIYAAEGWYNGDIQNGMFIRFQNKFNILDRLGQWIHVVTTYSAENSTISTYVDGILRDSDAASAFTMEGVAFYIGKLHPSYASIDSPFKGDLDEIRVYNRALSASEISSLYNNY